MEGINLALLPPLTIVEQINYEKILLEVAQKAQIENLSPSDPAYRIALAASYREALLRQDANEQAKGVMLAFAVGAQLDHIGVTYYKLPDNSPVLRLEGESDDDYRARLQASPEGLSVAGPDGAYIFNTKSASPLVKDVAVHSPEPVEVDIYVLTYDSDGVPSYELMQIIYNYLWTRRPLTDLVRINAANLTNYRVVAELILKTSPEPELIQANALKSLQNYVELKRTLGSRIVESGLHAALHVEGVEEVHLTNWTDLVCGFDTAPYCESIDLSIGGYA